MRTAAVFAISLGLLTSTAQAGESASAAGSTIPIATHSEFSALPYERIPIGKPFQSEITKSSPAFAFDEGTSHLRAYVLPESAESHSIQILTNTVGIWMPNSYVFYPFLTFLDSSYAVVAKVDPELAYRNNYWSSKKSGWGAEVSVPPGARYLVLHCPESKVGTPLYSAADHSSQSRPQITMVNGIPITTGAANNWWDTYMVVKGIGRVQLALK